jgi:hypothetical protein
VENIGLPASPVASPAIVQGMQKITPSPPAAPWEVHLFRPSFDAGRALTQKSRVLCVPRQTVALQTMFFWMVVLTFALQTLFFLTVALTLALQTMFSAWSR